VRAATAGDAGPRGLDQVLYPGPPGALGPDVLQHSEGPSGTQDASHLVEARGWIVHAAEDQAAQNGVERRVTERQRLRARLDEPRRGGAAPRAEKRVESGIDAQRAWREQRQAPAGATAEIEDSPLHVAAQPVPPAFESGAFGEREGGIVEPGDLLEPARHGCSWPRRGGAAPQHIRAGQPQARAWSRPARTAFARSSRTGRVSSQARHASVTLWPYASG